MSLGLSQNNPGNLRVGNFTYDGEITSSNGFRAFSSMAYGIRAWIMNLHYQITVKGLNTYGAYLTAYAPVSDGNSADYPTNVCGSDFNLTDTIATDPASLEKLFYDQATQEIGADEANSITDTDFQSGLTMFNTSVPGWVMDTAEVLPSNYFLITVCVLFVLIIGYLAFRGFKK